MEKGDWGVEEEGWGWGWEVEDEDGVGKEREEKKESDIWKIQQKDPVKAEERKSFFVISCFLFWFF